MKALDHKKTAVIDLETTGGEDPQIIEISIVIIKDGIICEDYTKLVNPEKKISAASHALTGIDDKMVELAPKFYEIAEDIELFTKDCILVAHPISFDYEFLQKKFQKLGIDYQRKTKCTFLLSKEFLPQINSYKLKDLCELMSVETKNLHRALPDALSTARLYLKLVHHANRWTKKSTPSYFKYTILPEKVSSSEIEKLPRRSGVVLFLDKDGTALLIDHGENIFNKVIKTFHLQNSKALIFKNKDQITKIEYRCFDSKFVSHLYAEKLVRYLKPRFQKKTYTHKLISTKNRDGEVKLKIIANRDSKKGLQYFRNKKEADIFYSRMQKCLDTPVYAYSESTKSENTKNVNLATQKFLDQFRYPQENFFIQGPKNLKGAQSFVLFEKGVLKGHGQIPTLHEAKHVSDFTAFMIPIFEGPEQRYQAIKYIKEIQNCYQTRFSIVSLKSS